MLDTTRFTRVLSLDRARGIVDVEAGIMWPALVDYLLKAQVGRSRQWGMAQKQTGADRLTIGGALSANVHGRGLKLKPFVGDVESFVLIDARAMRARAAGPKHRAVSSRYWRLRVVRRHLDRQAALGPRERSNASSRCG